MKTVYILLCIFSCCLTEGNPFTYNDYVGLGSALRQWYHAECLLLVYFNDLISVHKSVEISKIFSKNAVMTSSLMFEILNETSNEYKCQGNRPLYLLLNDDDEMKRLTRFITKLSSYPRWVLFSNSSQAITEMFENIFVRFNCEVLVAESVGSEIKLTEVYQVAEGFPLTVSNFGSWSQEAGLRATTAPLYERRQDLQGLVVKAVCMDFAPLSIMTRNRNLKIVVGGSYGMVWQSLERRLNFTTDVTNSTDALGNFGSLVNGTWTGVISTVVTGDADVAVNTFTYSNERMDAVDFLYPISETKVLLIVRKPTRARFQWTSFLSPFETCLWLGVLSSILLTGALLAASFKVGGTERLKGRCGENGCLAVSALFHVFGLYCSQGTPLSPRAVSSRTVLLLAGLTSTVVVAAYSGALTSFITVQKLDLPYETIQEYVDDPNYQLEMTPNSFWLYLNSPWNDLFRALQKRLINRINDMPGHWSLGLKRICDSEKPIGFISPFVNIDGFSLGDDCEFVSVPGHLVVDIESIVVAKDSPYLRIFNRNLQHLRVAGLLQHFNRLAWPKPLAKLVVPFPNVQLYQVVPIIAVLVVGMVISLLVLLAEATF